MGDICAAASWLSPKTFVWFYQLDVTAPSVTHSVLSAGPVQQVLRWSLVWWLLLSVYMSHTTCAVPSELTERE